MKASLPFKYITAVKGGKHYVVFDYKDNEGKRKRKWVGTDLPENCKKKELSAKVDEIVADFYKEYISGNIVKSEKAVKMRISEDGQSLKQLRQSTHSRSSSRFGSNLSSQQSQRQPLQAMNTLLTV